MDQISVERRAARHAALGDPVRLAIVDELLTSDRSPAELRRVISVESNLLAHHLDVLERAGLIGRSASSGDRRRRYVHLHREELPGLLSTAGVAGRRAVFVCTHNSARSQLAAALWTALTDAPASSGGTHPAARVHPEAIRAGRRAGIDLSGTQPRSLGDVSITDALVITVCDQAHEALDPPSTWWHWSIADPVRHPTKATFDRTVAELRDRIDAVAAA
ncbi:MAG: helix-turn-helix domain-containing protein [Ilumatobacteraceae bacterium]